MMIEAKEAQRLGSIGDERSKHFLLSENHERRGARD